MEITNNIKYLILEITGLKILSFVNTGVPVQVWPGAPFLIKSTTYNKNSNKHKLDQSSTKEYIIALSDATMTPNCGDQP